MPPGRAGRIDSEGGVFDQWKTNLKSCTPPGNPSRLRRLRFPLPEPSPPHRNADAKTANVRAA